MKKLIALGTVALMALVLSQPAYDNPETGWYDASWKSRKKLSGDLSRSPVRLEALWKRYDISAMLCSLDSWINLD